MDIKKFNIFKKKLVVIDEIDFLIGIQDTIQDITERVKRVIGKEVIFTGKDKKEVKIFVKSTEIILKNVDNYLIYFYDANSEKHSVSAKVKIKILGKKIISPIDPYGEENWEETN